MYSYSGNSSYCFTNSLHMSLKAAGMKAVPEVGFIECLTTLPFGKFYVREAGLFFPSGPGIEPDLGLSLAVKTMGWMCDAANGGTPDEALARLRAALEHGPALIGPVDMGGLRYMPGYEYRGGADHFVMALGIEADRVRVHDPAGYPYATLPMDDFLEAWRADNVNYGQRPYRMRWNFRQIETVSRAAMIERIQPAVRERLAVQQGEPGFIVNSAALRALAEDLRGVVPPNLSGFLLHFALPLAARRASDAAAFLLEAGKTEAASIIVEESRCFGSSLYDGLQGQWIKAADPIEQVAALEERLAAAI